MKVAEQKTADALNAVKADLGAFKARGGKLILYHGWDDPAISSLNTIHYYNSVSGKWDSAMWIRSCGCIWRRECSIAPEGRGRIHTGKLGI